MKILFYYDIPTVNCTLLTWVLSQELTLLGHHVDYGKPNIEKIPSHFYGRYDWVRAAGPDSWAAVKLAREIGAKVHIHDEGAPPYRVGLESAVEWGYDKEFADTEIEHWKKYYKNYMNGMYEADSVSLNGKLEFDIIEALFDGKKLGNAHRMCYGVDARYALTLPNFPRQNHMVTVSRLEYNKQVHEIAQALALLDVDKLPFWLIIGYGNQEQVNRLTSYCKEHRIKMGLWPCFGAQKWMAIKTAKLMLQGYGGLPPGEGLLCDTPTLVFGHWHMKELYDDALPYAENHNIEDFAQKVEEMLSYCLRTARGKQRLLNGELYAKTQRQVAIQYDNLFSGRDGGTEWPGKN